jgi:alkanesulfonate monooxygenase SsuD/methylene tetrahydromethanopterin reductase-like flavin-dependent oxidoreductase (luciferase family)
MRCSIYLNPQTPGPDDDGRLIDEVLGQVDLAERLGFADVWLTDHQFTGYNAYSEPITLAAAITQRNPSLRIGFAVAVLPLRHPVTFVTECNLLDQLSKGRLVVGVGAGNSPDEFAGFGFSADERHAMMAEFVAVMEQAWNAPPAGFRYSGRYFNGVVNGRIIPAPFQKPHPPIAYASATPATLEWIGRKGWSLLAGPHDPDSLASRLYYYFKGQDDAGLDAATRQRALAHTGFNRQVYVAEPGEDWRDTLGEAIEVYLRKSAKANVGIDNLSKTDLEQRKVGYLKNWLIAGTADEVIERLRPFARLGFRNLMCWFAFGHLADRVVRASIERFASRVMPVLRETPIDEEWLARVRAGEVTGVTRNLDSPAEPVVPTQAIP